MVQQATEMRGQAEQSRVEQATADKGRGEELKAVNARIKIWIRGTEEGRGWMQ
jgi:hypothetical protein